MAQIWVIGGGPAGLMAAEVLAHAGHAVTVAEAMPTVARKFLMAGKSGLNLTKVEPQDEFRAAYRCDAPALHGMTADIVQDWARGLGQAVFTGSTGRVFPVAMKASPLLRAWLARLADLGVALRTRWRWTGFAGDALAFDTPDGPRSVTPDATVLALGGASWSRLGSDGAWAPWLADRGVTLTPFSPANAGLRIDWSPHMARHYGAPVKGIALHIDGGVHRGELTISAKGLEGGGLYPLTPAIRQGAALTLDLMPDRSAEDIARRLTAARGSLPNRLRKLGLSAAAQALLQEWARPLPAGSALATRIKSLSVRHDGLRPLDEAISTAGGIAWSAVDDALMLRAVPGTFVAGEMLDWEAPTGGYLITGCLATGGHAGQGASAWLAR